MNWLILIYFISGNIVAGKPKKLLYNFNMKNKEQASGRAVAALILGILSISCFGIIAAIPAIIFSLQELKAIQAGQAAEAGEIITKIGLILGIIVVALTVMILLAIITFTFIPHNISITTYHQGLTV